MNENEPSSETLKRLTRADSRGARGVMGLRSMALEAEQMVAEALACQQCEGSGDSHPLAPFDCCWLCGGSGRAPAPRADEGAERSKPHLLHGVFDGDGLTRFRLECPYEVKGVLPAGRRCWSLDDDGEIDSLQCFAKGWVDECGAELVSFEITDPSFPIPVDVELDGLLQTPNLTLHARPASSGDGGAPTPVPYDEHERQMTEALRERDEAEEWADRLAYALAPIEVIGEHSSGNNPWQNALDHAPAAPSPVPEEGPPTWIGRATNPDDDRFTVRALVPWGHGNGPPHNALVEVRILHATPEQREGPGK